MPPTPCLPVTYLEENSSSRPAAVAVYDSGREVTFAELEARVKLVAAKLRAQDLASGDVVAVQLPNVWEYVVLELAIPYAGGVIMPLPPSLGEAELLQALTRSEASLLVTGPPERHSLVRAVAARTGGVRLTLEAEELCTTPTQPSPKGGGETGQPSPLKGPPPPGEDKGGGADPNRIVEIALTSGTTGLPKLASLSAGLKQATFEGFTRRLEVVPEDRVLIMSPVTQGIGGMCLYCLRLGAALVMLREPRFSPEHTLATAASTRATLLVGVPTNVSRMLGCSALDRTDLSSCRATAVAGAPMPPEMAREWEERTGSRICIFYGSMDAGQLAVGSPSDAAEKRWHTVGRPHDSCELMICDAEGRPLPSGEVGEICMRGATVQERYWGEESGPHSADGWAHMGDLGFLDPDGYLHVVGRLKDIIIRGGSNVNPHEVEAVLRQHPAISDVCLVGRPDPDLGERVVAFVVSRDDSTPSLDELRKFLGERGLAKYKWPEYLELLDEIPVAGPGKVNRKELRERYASALR